ncbi:peptidoglycan recognition protein family protein [Adlercreutzia caecimuris]|uniref:N-acetylmuramoyl-L-alanine amidase n=1 Tax=Adlercreutzia caecimuris B7 TaxID=1235794 RepID=R9KWP3_9ACTN|nr:N-acetylmuramoyl-L-alanine amidase [Adlercreutzia caecimuris]EOS50974.1 hypothetical protein C811_01391 [Adlercreutzia caecimuris B7]
MALKINTYHGSHNRSKRAGGLKSIVNFVEHYTGGKGSAKNNCIYFAAADRRASADFFIDKNGDIWEYNNVLDGYCTWHCGDGGGKYGITNTNSVGIEVVSDGEDFTEAQIESLAALYTHLCSVLGRKLNVVRHYDASRKQCPAPYVDSTKWAGLKARTMGGKVSGKPAASKPTTASKPATAKPAAKGDAWVRNLQTECNKQGYSKQKVDGIAGPNTLSGCPTLRKGSKGNITKLMQQRLISIGYSCGKYGADGSFGSGTLAAVKKFQKAKGLTTDGIVGRNTWRKLLGL